MPNDQIRVRMLGGFSIEYRGQTINDASNRMKKVWLLLAYLIYHRKSHLTQEHYAALLRGKGDEPADPNANLKAMFYRVRTLLNQLDDDAGHDLILRREGSYTWNTEIPLQLDVEEFEQLCREAAAASSEDTALSLYQKALALYEGDFLVKLSSEPWVMPINAYYHRLYLETVETVLPLLEARQLWESVAALCERALTVEPYSEALYQHLMRCKLAVGDRSAAQELYEEMSERLFSTFGVMPSAESRSLYREACRAAESISVPAAAVRDQLREPVAAAGALFCEYDFFRLLYQAQARSLSRTGDTIHIALFSVHAQGRKELSRRSLDLAMENLKNLFIASLRQGDVITQCSVSQLIVMLPQANYENSCLVCNRLTKAFNRQYPHSPVTLSFSVQPLEPTGADFS